MVHLRLRHHLKFNFAIACLALLLAAGNMHQGLAQNAQNTQANSGSSTDPAAGGAGDEISQDQQANAGHSVDVRLNYFKRFPYAKAASATQLGGADLLIPVEAGKNLKQSANKLDTNHDTPVMSLPVYQPVIKFCNDNPLNGICYAQPLLVATDRPCAFRDLELFKTAMKGVVGMPLSDTQFQIIDRENKQRFLELLFDPERFMWLATNTGQLQGAAAANSLAGVAENTFNSAYDRIIGGDAGGALINVANENAVTQTSGSAMPKTVSQACYMVLKMYHLVFVPMAILLLLPGAVITHTKGIVSRGFGLGGDDSTSPFEGILRALIAVFLIPATQLIISYSIDIGNSLALSVEPWISRDTIFNWAHEQSYNTHFGHEENFINDPRGAGQTVGGDPIAPAAGTGGGAGGGGSGSGIFAQNFTVNIPFIGSFTFANPLADLFDISDIGAALFGQGKAANQDEVKVIPERQLWLSQTVQLVFNLVEYVISYMLIALTAFQVVILCYLLLLGPIAASFFAWPSGVGSLFRGVFTSWLNGVVVVSLWRFYWCVILAVAAQRIVFLSQNGGFNVNSEFEMMVFVCFLGMLLVVPFQPFNFDPGGISAQVLERGSQAAPAMSQAVQGAGAGMSAGREQQIARVMGQFDGAAQKFQPVVDIMEGNVSAQYEGREGRAGQQGQSPPPFTSAGTAPWGAPGGPPPVQWHNPPSLSAQAGSASGNGASDINHSDLASLPPGSSAITSGDPLMIPFMPAGGNGAHTAAQGTAGEISYQLNSMTTPQQQAAAIEKIKLLFGLAGAEVSHLELPAYPGTAGAPGSFAEAPPPSGSSGDFDQSRRTRPPGGAGVSDQSQGTPLGGASQDHHLPPGPAGESGGNQHPPPP